MPSDFQFKEPSLARPWYDMDISGIAQYKKLHRIILLNRAQKSWFYPDDYDDLYWETERLLLYIDPEDFLIIWES